MSPSGISMFSVNYLWYLMFIEESKWCYIVFHCFIVGSEHYIFAKFIVVNPVMACNCSNICYFIN